MAKTLQQSFGGGEVSPDFFGRIADAKYQSGLARCRNFMVLPHGPAVNRPGFKFVREVGNSDFAVRLIPFTYNTEQTMVLEFGHAYIRLHTQGASLLAGTPAAWSNATAYTVGDLVTSGGVVYYCILGHTNQVPPNATYWYAQPSSDVLTIPTPYAGTDLFAIHHVQSNDVLTLVHPSYAPRELRRLSATKWVLSTISFAPSITAPTGLTATPNTSGAVPTYPKLISYVITKVSKATGEESAPSTGDDANNDLSITGNRNELSWTSVGSDYEVNIYKSENGSALFGFIASRDGAFTTYEDWNVTPDYSRTPPGPIATFTGSGNYPGAVTYHEQRRWFAGTNNSPLGLWATKSGTETNMNRSPIPRDDDALSFTVYSREANRIRHLVPVGDLLPFTAGSEMRVSSVNSDAITPTSVNVKTESYVGANNVQPVLVNSNVIYAAARGGHMRELGFKKEAGGTLTGDLSLRATHLFDRLQIVDMAYQKAPYPIVWAVSSNGKLLGLTYVPEQEIGAWHQHDTDGLFESVCCVAEGNEDAVYCIVRRTINGVTKVFVERMASRLVGGIEDSFFVDAGLTYVSGGIPGIPVSGDGYLTWGGDLLFWGSELLSWGDAPDGVVEDDSDETVISGLDHLEGKTVTILSDGALLDPQVVVNGEVRVDGTPGIVHIGLPYTSELVTLPLAMQVDAALGQGRMKNVDAVYLRVVDSAAFKAGPSDDQLLEAKWRTFEAPGDPTALRTGEFDVVTRGDWNANGQVVIRQENPLPLEVVSMTLEVTLGG